MAALPDPFTTDQLAMAVGGSRKLVELLDKDGDQVADPALLVEVKSAAAADLYEILGVAFNPSDPNFAGSPTVQQRGVTLGVYWAWHKSNGGIAIPAEVKEARTEAIEGLKETRAGMRTLATVEDPTASAPAGQVDLDAAGTGWTRSNWGGFC